MADAITDAMEQLRNHQEQLDANGVMVGVSRQAVDEVLAYLDAMQAARQPQVPAEDVERVRAALEAADKRLCELTPNFPPDVGPDMQDAPGIEETGAVVMQIRDALTALQVTEGDKR